MRTTRLFLAIIWCAVAVYLLSGRAQVGPWAGWFAALFAIYNLVRWWTDRPQGLPLASPHRRRRDHDAPPFLNEYNEAFDFERQIDSKKEAE